MRRQFAQANLTLQSALTQIDVLLALCCAQLLRSLSDIISIIINKSMSEKILMVMDQEQGKEDYGPEVFIIMVGNFEMSTFDIKMRQMLDGLIEKDWAKVMVAAHTLKGSCG